MTDLEWKQWMAVTENSQFQWTADAVTHRNGRGELYYFGGTDGVYMRVQPDGRISIGTYEGSLPHIGEALFAQKAVQDCGSFGQALQKAMELGGQRFLQDMFSQKPSQELLEATASPGVKMTMM